MANLHNNDDVFKDDESNEPSSTEQQPISHDGHTVNVGGTTLPGYLVDAMNQFLRDQGLKPKVNKVPFGEICFSDVHRTTNLIWKRDKNSIASAAMWRVLNNITEGALKIEYTKLALEEKIIGYGFASQIVNFAYAEIEPYVNDSAKPEAIRYFNMLQVYFDILQYHYNIFVDRYEEFCQENLTEPDKTVLTTNKFSEIHPYLASNFLLYRTSGATDQDFEELLISFYDGLLHELGKTLRMNVIEFDNVTTS